MADLRLPQFVIVGAMKSATSSLYAWLAAQPEVFLAAPKETNFFSDDARWSKGPAWYSAQFDGAGADQLRGEASIAYASPDGGPVAAARMASVLPDARLLYVVREPVERLRSHYRHEVQRNRERRPLVEAVSEPGNAYVANSLYHRCLRPFIEAFPREQIAVVRFDDLTRPPHRGWLDVLRHLGLPERPSPGTVHNRTAELAQWSRGFRWLKEAGIVSFGVVARLPDPVRRAGRRVFMRSGPEFHRRLEGSLAPLPEAVVEPILEDLRGLERWLGVDAPLWPDLVPSARGEARP